MEIEFQRRLEAVAYAVHRMMSERLQHDLGEMMPERGAVSAEEMVGFVWSEVAARLLAAGHALDRIEGQAGRDDWLAHTAERAVHLAAEHGRTLAVSIAEIDPPEGR